jgi:hypothetical protein
MRRGFWRGFGWLYTFLIVVSLYNAIGVSRPSNLRALIGLPIFVLLCILSFRQANSVRRKVVGIVIGFFVATVVLYFLLFNGISSVGSSTVIWIKPDLRRGGASEDSYVRANAEMPKRMVV